MRKRNKEDLSGPASVQLPSSAAVGVSAVAGPLRSYAGGKAGSGVYQAIINLMPPHDVYIEAFLGGGAIMRMKRPARRNIGLEIDPKVWLTLWKDEPICEVFLVEAVEWLKLISPPTPETTLVYADPPYLMDVRSCKQAIYKHEFHTEAEHTELLDVLLSLPCMVMISGYDSELYNRKLAGWRKVQFTGVSRRGPKVETVWMNFPEPAELHDYHFLGRDRRERQDIKRQKARWIARLRKMPAHKRYAMLAAIDEYKEKFLTDGEAAGDGISVVYRSTKFKNL